MASKGIKKVSGFGHGDHYINIKVRAPKKLDEKQKALLEAYAELESGKGHISLGTYKEGVSNLTTRGKFILFPGTPGTIHGLTYALGGRKTVISDPGGVVAALREALGEEGEEEQALKSETGGGEGAA